MTVQDGYGRLGDAQASVAGIRLRVVPAKRAGTILSLLLLAAVLIAVSVLCWSAMFATAKGEPGADIKPRPEAGVQRKVDVPPPVEPMALAPGVSQTEARSINAAVPIAAGELSPAEPFRFLGNDLDRARAAACLSTAVIYEAGDDPAGERAVAQVVLNRVRHPAFPKSVCGVVFQGSERATGCQFTFTCDGALSRMQSAAALARAGAIAAEALAGAVDPSVGLATHYHADFVVPRWSAEMDKIAQVGAHLFYRWRGRWGEPATFLRSAKSVEPLEPRIAASFAVHGDPAESLIGVTQVVPGGEHKPPVASPGSFLPISSDPNVFMVTIPAGTAVRAYPQLAEQACAGRSHCMFTAWSDTAAAPRELPVTTSQMQSSVFQYLRDPALSEPRTRWNCAVFPRDDREECFGHQH